MNSKEKIVFRTSKIWKDFRKKLIKARGGACELCGGKYRLSVHHLYKENYTCLDESRFIVVCSPCHLFLHKKNNRIDDFIINLKTVLYNHRVSKWFN